MSLVVEATGPLLLVQDLGRSGSMHLGVPPSGALDPAALALANRLVGNAESAAGLEILLGDVGLRAQASTRVAVTGAQVELRVGGRAAPWGMPVSVRAGELVEIVAPSIGLRSWLAVAGGLHVDPVLGSRSTDTLTGLGPPPVAVGDVLPVGAAVGDVVVAAAVPGQRTPKVRVLRLMLGPRDDWFTAESAESLFGQEYAVAAASNRVALRLTAEQPLRRRADEELPSEGIITGAVQVPTSGQPLIFLTDHPVTGGYPVVGVTDPEGISACAQLRPGDRLRFRR